MMITSHFGRGRQLLLGHERGAGGPQQEAQGTTGRRGAPAAEATEATARRTLLVL